MKLSLLSLCLCVALAQSTATNYSSVDPSSSNLTIRTSTGTFTGIIDPIYPSTRQWLAIPFARPPVGELRWLPPQPLPSDSYASSRHRYSTHFPPSCPQFFSSVPSFWNSPMTLGNLITNGFQNTTSGLVGEATSEDCLYLAIWAPLGEPPTEKGWPVLFFMTGGGFSIGGVDLPWQNPVSWVDRSQEFVVVSVNYRVNIFGFPQARGLASSSPDASQNLGILDQRAALEWARDNVAAFGGDPTRITQWGRSAGAASTDIHAYAYKEDPIANAYFMESGTVFVSGGPRMRDETYSNFSFVARELGCAAPSTIEDTDGTYELDCMRLLSPIVISNFIGRYTDAGTTPPLTFNLIPDEQTVFSNYSSQSPAALPALISFTANEFSSLIPWPADPSLGPSDEAQEFIDFGNQAFVCGSYNSTRVRNDLPSAPPVYRMQYAAQFPAFNVYPWLGAYHNSETPLIFGTYHWLDHVAPATELEIRTSETMQGMVAAFAKDPLSGLKEWGWEPQVVEDENGGKIARVGGESLQSGEVWTVVNGDEVDGICKGTGEYDAFP